MLTFTSDQYTGGPAVEVKFDRYDGARAGYQWTIRLDGNNADLTFTGTDLYLGSDDEPRDVKALSALASFIGAWVESHEHEERTGATGENADLFPRAMWDACPDAWRSFAEEMNMEFDDEELPR